MVHDLAVAAHTENESLAGVENFEILVVKARPDAHTANLIKSRKELNGSTRSNGGQVSILILPARYVGIDARVVEIQQVHRRHPFATRLHSRGDTFDFDELTPVAFDINEGLFNQCYHNYTVLKIFAD